jgi:hypothetical protein
MLPKHQLTPKTGEEKGCIDEDTKTLALSIGGLLLEAFKVVMACLLSLFVPQKCAGKPLDPDPALQVDHDCGINENLQDLSGFNKFVVTWNFLTLGVFILHYSLVYRRESWMITFLDEDDNEADNNLALEGSKLLKPYPGIANDLMTVNKRVLITSVLGIIFLVVNIIASAWLLFREYYAGFRTVTTYITNVLLVVGVLKTTISNAYAGLQHHLALSCVHFEPVSYNVVDRDHRECCRNPDHTSAALNCKTEGKGKRTDADGTVPTGRSGAASPGVGSSTAELAPVVVAGGFAPAPTTSPTAAAAANDTKSRV